MIRSTYFVQILALILGSAFGLDASSEADGIEFQQSLSLHYHSEIFAESFGPYPDDCGSHPNDIISETIEETDDYSIIRAQIEGCAGPVNMLIGVPTRPSNSVVLALPQTSIEGADEVMGLRGDENLDFGRLFLEYGHTVISPDVFISGPNFDEDRDWDTADHYEEYPNWSAAGRMAVDNAAALAMSEQFAPNAECFAAVGHSLGGHNALFLASLVPAIDLVISSGGFEMMETDNNRERWSRDSWFVYFPEPPKWDFDDILTSIAPRPVYVIQGENDPIWTNETLLHEQISDLDLPNVQLTMFDGEHEFPEYLQERSVEFVANHCSPEPQNVPSFNELLEQLNQEYPGRGYEGYVDG